MVFDIEMLIFDIKNIKIKLYNLVVLKLWDYAQTIFRSGKLNISYARAEIGPNKTEIGPKKIEKKRKTCGST